MTFILQQKSALPFHKLASFNLRNFKSQKGTLVPLEDQKPFVKKKFEYTFPRVSSVHL